MLTSHFGAVSFGYARLGAPLDAPAPLAPGEITSQSLTPFQVTVYSVQCGLRRNILDYPSWLTMPTVDGKWGSQTKAALDYYLSQSPRAQGELFYDTPRAGSTTVALSAALLTNLLQGVDNTTCVAPAGINDPARSSAPAPQPTLAPPPPGTSTFSFTPILIGLAAVTVLGGLGWVMWRRRGRLKQRMKG